MGRSKITEKDIQRYIRDLEEGGYARGSIEKYVRDVRAFWAWAGAEAVTKGALLRWRAHLEAAGRQPKTINSMLAALNCFFRTKGRGDLRLKYLKVQRKLFRSRERELTRAEYARLVETAERQEKPRLSLLMETICATGIRVGEVRYITVEAVRAGQADIHLKGKVRTILLPGKLCRKLRRYAREREIASGEIFRTRRGKGLSRRQIWAEMKALCEAAEVAPSKVFPHNLRHLFARTFYRVYKDVARLADLLGHSSIETTRIYLISTGAEHARQIERLGLVS
ncbi:tyrosine-type recombinase/integrase [uncultured Oscillibacter sp.]|uniref:tyrosine-type recombinase/integrase n=1 Tax=uncultured Oscillibacter sp. TaxID=876091 RepID=UPI00260F22F0|nr:tyrosine-type recombinase/integrase [uncultured Oscillibacter sp.]